MTPSTWHLKWPQIILTALFMFHGQFITRNVSLMGLVTDHTKNCNHHHGLSSPSVIIIDSLSFIVDSYDHWSSPSLYHWSSSWSSLSWIIIDIINQHHNPTALAARRAEEEEERKKREIEDRVRLAEEERLREEEDLLLRRQERELEEKLR